jgi:hypothetical protein
MAARNQSQVIAHHIDSQGTEYEKYSNPEAPVTMRLFPIRTMGMQCVMVTVFYLTHWFPISRHPRIQSSTLQDVAAEQFDTASNKNPDEHEAVCCACGGHGGRH